MQERDFEWFLENYEHLYNTYGQSFLAIKNKSVLGSYSSFREALDATLKSEELGTFIIQECDGSELAYTIRIASMNFMQPRRCG